MLWVVGVEGPLFGSGESEFEVLVVPEGGEGSDAKTSGRNELSMSVRSVAVVFGDLL